MTYGFVYILGNEFMPDVFKIGCTERSPHARADELSKPTGVPSPFRVLCYAEFSDFQGVERRMHEWCKDYRINNGREFFQGCLRLAVTLLWFHPERWAFTDCTAGSRYALESELSHRVCTEKHENYFDDLRDPFAKRDVEDKRIAERHKFLDGLQEEMDADLGAEQLADAANDTAAEEAA